MKKKVYMSPHMCVVYAQTETLLAGSGGLKGKTSGDATPSIDDGGDATDDNPYKPEGGYEIW